MDSRSVITLLLALAVIGSALAGALIALAGVWLIWATRILHRLGQQGERYLSTADNETARQLRAAHDVATGMTFMRQALRAISPQMAAEFTPPDPEPKKK